MGRQASGQQFDPCAGRAPAGFSLVELMIVMAIVAALVAIALPTYQSYLARAQITEGLALATQAQTALVAFYAERGRWPRDNAEAGLESELAGRYVSAIEVGAPPGQIAIRFSGDRTHALLQGRSLLLQAHASQDAISWTCKGGGRGWRADLLPQACQ